MLTILVVAALSGVTVYDPYEFASCGLSGVTFSGEVIPAPERRDANRYYVRGGRLKVSCWYFGVPQSLERDVDFCEVWPAYDDAWCRPAVFKSGMESVEKS